MYIYRDGKKLEEQSIHLHTISIYHQNQSLHVDRLKEKYEYASRWFGMFGFGTWFIVLVVNWTLQAMITSEALNNARSIVFLAYATGFLWIRLRIIRLAIAEPEAMQKFLPKVSKNGLPLNDLEYRPDQEYDDEQQEAFHKTYYDLALDTTKPDEHTPLNTPVLVDGQEVVAAYVNIELSTESGKPDADYRIQLADGTGVQVDADTFATMTSTIYETADGEEFLIPVLGGRNRSLRWGAVIDAVAAEQLLRKVPRTPENREYVIRLLDEVIYYHERALHMLRFRKAPRAPELPTTASLEAYAASFERPAE